MHLLLIKSTKDQNKQCSEPDVGNGAISSQGQKLFVLFNKIGFRY